MSRDPIIPGARLIEQGLAALPSQARLEVENRELRAKVAELESKIKELETKIEVLKPATGVEAEAGKILQLLFHQRELKAEDIARHLGLTAGVVKYHFDKLRQLDFIYQSRGFGEHSIRPKGREFIVKNGMA